MQKATCALLAIVISSQVSSIWAQGPEQRQKAIDGLRVDGGAALWREKPIDLSAQVDDIPKALRDERNSYWMTHLPPANGRGSAGFPAIGAPEIDPMRDVLWVTGDFESYKVFEASEGYGTYTDVRLRINDSIWNRTKAQVGPGESIDLGEPGGALRAPDGKTKSYNLRFVPYPPQPHHTYLMELTYVETGNFFRVNKMWDTTSGYAIPAGVVEGRHYIDGDAVIGGLKTAEAIAKVRAAVQSAQPEPTNGR